MLGQRFVMHSQLSVGRQGALAHGDKEIEHTLAAAERSFAKLAG